nr:hypothetical protein [Tanacetum cinerariifolium]
MNIFAFIHTSDPTKVRVVEREQNKDKPRLLDTTIGRIIPLLPVAPDRADSKLKASVERLFDEGGSGNQTKQGDSTRGGPDANIQPVVEAANTVVKDATPVQSRHQGKRKSVVVNAGEVFHPPKKPKEDHGTPSGASVNGKSRSALQRLLAEAVLNAEVEVAAIPTLPFVTASISTTPEREDGDHTDSLAEPNLRTIGAQQRFVISSDSSHYSGTNVAEAEVDSLTRSSIPIMTIVTTTTSTVNPTLVTKEKFVKPSPFGAGSSFAGGTDPITGVFLDFTGSDFLVGAIRTVINPDTDLQKVYVPQWSVTNGSRLDDGRVCREVVDEFSPSKFFASVCRMEHDHLFTEFNVRAARQMSLSAEAREEEIESLKSWSLLREVEAAEAIRLRADASNLETGEKSLRGETNAFRKRNVILEKERNALDVKVTELETSAMSKERELMDLNALVTSLSLKMTALQIGLGKTHSDVIFLWKEKRVRLLVGFPGAPTTPIYSPGSSSSPIYSSGSSTPPRYSPRASTPQSYSPGFKKCRVLKLQALAWKDNGTRGNSGIVYASEQHTVISAALFHEVYITWENFVWSSLSFEILGKTHSDVIFLWKEKRVRLLVGFPGAPTIPIYSPRSSSTPIYSSGSLTPPRYSPRASTPQSYSPGFKKCRVLKLQALAWKDNGTRGNSGIVYASEQHTIISATLFHEVYINMRKLGLE